MKRTLIIVVGLTLFIIGLSFVFPASFQLADAKLIDFYFSFRGKIPTQNKIVLATIDEKSLSKLGRWPWPRSTMAKLLDTLAQWGVKSVGFDITFSETSEQDPVLTKALQGFEKTYLGYFFYQSKEEFLESYLTQEEIKENDASILGARLSLSSNQTKTSGKNVYGVQANVPLVSKAVGGARQGFFNVFPDDDGVVRKMPLILFYKDNAYPSLSLQMASTDSGFSPVPVFEEGGYMKGLGLGENFIPVDPYGELHINYRGPSKTFPHVSISNILEGKTNSDQWKDKIVLVGATAVGIYDIRVTPLDPNMSGLEVLANTVDNILAGDFLRAGFSTELISFFVLIFSGLFLGFLLFKLRPYPGLFCFLISIFLMLGGGYFFFRKNILIYNFKPLLNSVLIFGTVTVHKYLTEEREKRKVRKAFQYYLSPILIKRLLEDPDQLKLGGERKELTVLFSDIRNFTATCERLSPEKVVLFLDEYFTVMTEILFKHGGMLDKYIGDAIMGVFGAPIYQEDHALRAMKVALEMMEATKTHEKEWCEKYGFSTFRIGIGVHTGPMSIGNLGSSVRFNYSVVGDSVNLAARLEQLNKEYGTMILVSDAHYQFVKDIVKAREIGSIRLRGKQESTLIYEIQGPK